MKRVRDRTTRPAKAKYVGKIKKSLCGVINANTNLPFLPICFGNNKKEHPALVDTGSTFSFISHDLLNELLTLNDVNVVINDKDLNCSTANSTDLVISKCCFLKVKIQHLSWKFEFLLSKDIPVSIILGGDFVSKTQLMVNLVHRNYFFLFNSCMTFPLLTDSSLY